MKDLTSIYTNNEEAMITGGVEQNTVNLMEAIVPYSVIDRENQLVVEYFPSTKEMHMVVGGRNYGTLTENVDILIFTDDKYKPLLNPGKCIGIAFWRDNNTFSPKYYTGKIAVSNNGLCIISDSALGTGYGEVNDICFDIRYVCRG